MKKFKEVEETRIASHTAPARDSVHRSSLLVPELPGAVAEISFLNHFLLKRGYPNVACRITAIDPEGKRIESRLEPITEPRVYRFRLTGSVAGPVATYMVEFFAAQNLFIPFPAVMVNHVGDGFTNTVHAFNRVLNDVFENDAINAQVVPEASVDVSFRGGQDTFAVFTAGPTACDSELAIELVAPDKTRRASVPLRVPRLCQRVVSLRETFTDLTDEVTGVLRIQQPPQPMFYGRMLTGIRTKDGQFSANHSYYDTSGAPEYWEDGRPSVRAYPHFAGFQSAVRMYPVQAPGELSVSVAFHAADGRELGRVLAGDVASPGPRFLDAGVDALARAAGIDVEEVRSFVVRAEASEGGVPCRTNHQLAYASGGLSSSINVSLFNPNVYSPPGKKGLTWGQMLVGSSVESRIAIVGNSPMGEDCDVDMAFYDEAGHVTDLKRRLVVGGSIEVGAADLKLDADQAPVRPVWVVARCPRPDVSLFTVTRTSGSGHCSGEHGF